EESEKNGLHPQLKLIPEVVLKAEPKILDEFHIEEDRDNFDYIYLLEEEKDYKGNKYRNKRNFTNRFKRLYSSSYKLIELVDPETQKQILDLFDHWQKLKEKENEEVKNELLAIRKMLDLANELKLICIGIYINKKLIAFSINELLLGGYAINLFEKADITYQGIFPYLRSITASYLLEQGGKFLNHEQDLGIEGLRKSKMSYNPQFFLKKYTISKKKS
ncbi:MAG: phosphatidylglycerol lysyltransferase domain-containing protein, partial [Candidatus Daviesbacteria bacterium]|nr:phosphatidylglycerol lysyltransferase domain-containing protein [Candidatus Daviesbacteria bacterium]